MSTGGGVEEPLPVEPLDHGEGQGGGADWGEWKGFEEELPHGSEPGIGSQSSIPSVTKSGEFVAQN